jgi:uncharacterized membrane protein YeiH
MVAGRVGSSFEDPELPWLAMTAEDEGSNRITRGAGLLRQVDLAATGVFAVEGAAVGVVAHLDLFGVVVVACVTALGGGALRDLLIGAIPPAALTDRLYIPTALVAGLLTFALHRPVGLIPTWLLTGLDAAGLALFCASGAAKALDYGLNAVSAAFMGTLTAVGGGVMRDLLVGRVPAVLRVDVYAVAALLGSSIIVFGLRRGLPRSLVMTVGGAACFGLRVLSAWQHWNLPTIAH